MRIKRLATRMLNFFSWDEKRRQLPLFSANAPAGAVKLVPEDPTLKAKWIELRRTYFPDRSDLDTYRVSWSQRRQKRTLGSCALRNRKITIAKELRDPDCARWLAPLLYHEMCHAALGESIQYSHGKRAWHGADFRALEQRHPDILAFDMWVKSGGWARAVRRERSRAAYQKRRNKEAPNRE